MQKFEIDTKILESKETKELQEIKLDQLDSLNATIKMCIELGNKDWKNNFLVKQYAENIRKIDKILNER